MSLIKIAAIASAGLALAVLSFAIYKPVREDNSTYQNQGNYDTTATGQAVEHITTVNSVKVYTFCRGPDRIYIAADAWGNSIDVTPNGCAMNSVQ